MAAMFVLGAGAAVSTLADDFAPSHHCRKPYKPYRFSSESELESFKDEVERYGECIKEFVSEQKEAARTHQEAGSEAIDEWNSFVRLELR
ncbi:MULTISPECIES: hypothetical protein [Anaeromyxobacter]|uniref:hypothetical protein n=1 Tax=Anaeromyxobacter TaxID=161492 RepID=UPI001F55D848|nr:MULTISPECIES: hypothetical protein [unclassified Anaeromyxobacter]